MLHAPDPHREAREFRLSLAAELGAKRGKVAGSFVSESKGQVIEFYRTTVQGLRPWSASAPKLPDQPEVASAAASTEPPDFTDPGREYGEASLPSG